MRIRNAWAFGFAALLATASSGCMRRETQVQRADRSQVLLRGIGYEVTDIDPQLGTGTAEQAVTSGLFEGLVTEDPRDLHPVPGVASRWDISPDKLAYTFFLRPDARWSNGKPVIADDFVQSWKRILSPRFLPKMRTCSTSSRARRPSTRAQPMIFPAWAWLPWASARCACPSSTLRRISCRF